MWLGMVFSFTARPYLHANRESLLGRYGGPFIPSRMFIWAELGWAFSARRKKATHWFLTPWHSGIRRLHLAISPTIPGGGHRRLFLPSLPIQSMWVLLLPLLSQSNPSLLQYSFVPNLTLPAASICSRGRYTMDAVEVIPQRWGPPISRFPPAGWMGVLNPPSCVSSWLFCNPPSTEEIVSLHSRP